MWAKIGQFFLTTKLGLAIMLAVAISASAGLTYHLVKKHAYDQGFAAAQQKCDAEKSAAKTKLLNDRADEAKKGSTIASTATKAGTVAVAAVDKVVKSDKEKDHADYKKPLGKPVALGSCVRAVPDSVQARIDEAVSRSND